MNNKFRHDDEVRIVIADDHPIVRHGLREMIEVDSSLKVVAEAGDGASALAQIEQLRPDVAVLDIDMPGMDGLTLAREIRTRRIEVQVVLLTIHREEELFNEAIDLGVRGYVLKDSATNDIIASIRAAAIGQPFISPQLSALLLKRRARSDALAKEKPGLEALTAMERRILKLIASDKTSKDIARQLFISYRTVETHRTNICRKLDLKGNLALVKFAVTHKSDL
jgi:DNA-binding NarL/FixJ family response regulator